MRRSLWLTSVAALLGAAIFAGSAQAQTPGAGTVRITSPVNGSTVNAPVTLQVEIGGVTVRAAAEGDPAAFHYHALVDVDPASVIQAGQPLPTGQENIIHTADRSLPLTNLAPGQHTVTAILTRTDHVPLTPPVQDRVAFTVGGGAPPAAAQPAAPVAAPRTGSGGMALLADQQVTPALVLLLAAAACVSLGGLAVGARVRR